MTRTARWTAAALVGAPLLGVGGCFGDDVLLRVLSDNIQVLVLGIADTIVRTLFDQALGLA